MSHSGERCGKPTDSVRLAGNELSDAYDEIQTFYWGISWGDTTIRKGILFLRVGAEGQVPEQDLLVALDSLQLDVRPPGLGL